MSDPTDQQREAEAGGSEAPGQLIFELNTPIRFPVFALIGERSAQADLAANTYGRIAKFWINLQKNMSECSAGDRLEQSPLAQFDLDEAVERLEDTKEDWTFKAGKLVRFFFGGGTRGAIQSIARSVRDGFPYMGDTTAEGMYRAIMPYENDLFDAEVEAEADGGNAEEDTGEGEGLGCLTPVDATSLELAFVEEMFVEEETQRNLYAALYQSFPMLSIADSYIMTPLPRGQASSGRTTVRAYRATGLGSWYDHL